MTHQHPLTLVTPVREGEHDKLQTLLMQFRADVQAGVPQSFQSLDTIHYARWILLEPKDADGKPETDVPVRLVFSSNYDGEEDAHLTGLATQCASFIDHLYGHCVDYPSGAARTGESRKEYLSKWKVKESAFFVGAPGRTLPQIRQENELRDYVWGRINASDWKGKSAREIHQALKQDVLGKPVFQWARQPITIPGIRWLGMVLLGLVLLILSPLILIWIILIHFLYERTDEPLGLTPSQVSGAHIKELEEYEDLANQNQFTQVLIMKPGRMRLLTLQGLMLFAKALISFLFLNGKLMGIPTIHFARWVMIDNQKRMLFFSNFDGSWQQYLGDFIDKSGWGLTGIWSNTMKFPRTKFLFTGGAYDAEHFLAWSRYFQVPTAVWYCAYPHLSIKNIINNSYIRNELFRDLDEAAARQFLQRF
ncbi:MAG TPA: hypothetical protein VL832_11470 [Puia sp.]|nr:hypothetical protein [Puia sp.]